MVESLYLNRVEDAGLHHGEHFAREESYNILGKQTLNELYDLVHDWIALRARETLQQQSSEFVINECMRNFQTLLNSQSPIQTDLRSNKVIRVEKYVCKKIIPVFKAS